MVTGSKDLETSAEKFSRSATPRDEELFHVGGGGIIASRPQSREISLHVFLSPDFPSCPFGDGKLDGRLCRVEPDYR
jgi:hypothetical protein